MADVFLSHASEDAERVAELERALKTESFETWFDGHLTGGDAWAPEIIKQLEASRCIILCWSESAVKKARSGQSPWLRSEADEAVRKGILINILLDQVTPPKPYEQFQYLNMIGWSGDRSADSYQGLLKAILQKLEGAPPSSEGQRPLGPRRRALLIGTGVVKGMPALPAVKNNLEELYQALRQPQCGFEAEKVFNPPAVQDLLEALDHFFVNGRPDSEGMILLYFCGYLLLDGSTLYLSVADAAIKHIKYNWISLDLLRNEYLNQSSERTRLVVLDGYYPQGDASQIKDALGPLAQGNIVITSMPPSLIDPWKERNTVFTGSLIRAFTSNEADADGNTVTTAQEVYDYVKRQMERREQPSPCLLSTGGSPSQAILTKQSNAKIKRPPLTPDQTKLIQTLSTGMDSGKVVVFLGDGVFNTNALSGLAVTTALAKIAGLNVAAWDQGIIPTPAEWLEQQHDREIFLTKFRAILEEQSKVASIMNSPAHNLILRRKRPWLTISAMYDYTLEDKLNEAEIPYVLLAHINHSKEGKDDNKILVLRNKHHPGVRKGMHPEAEICMPDSIVVEKDDCILYKLLGSPYLHDIELAKEHELDTVIATESDYIRFLAALQSAASRPTVLARYFGKARLLFLGFSLHLWHYRLVSHLFGRGQKGGSEIWVIEKPPIVVPRPATSFEAIFWDRLQPDPFVDIDLSTLCETLTPGRSGST